MLTWVIYRPTRARASSCATCPCRRVHARARRDGRPRGASAQAFAALARINTLYMIAGAWSGHIGTSFSSLEIMSWLFLNELRDLDKGPRRVRHLLLVEGARRAGALHRADRPRPAAAEDKLHQLRRLHGLPGHPHVETPTSRPTPARSAWASRRPRAWRWPTGWPATAAAHLRADRRRRAAGRAVLGVARVGRQSSASARSSPSSTTTRSSPTPGCEHVSALGDSRRSSARSAGTSAAATATTCARSSGRSARSTP